MTKAERFGAGAAGRPAAEPWVQAGFSPAVRRGQMVWLGGHLGRQGDAATDGEDTAAAQVGAAVASLQQSLESAGCTAADLVKLLCFYLDEMDYDVFLEQLRSSLPAGADPAVTAIPVPYLAVPGAGVLVEGYAMRESDGTQLVSQPVPDIHGDSAFPAAVRCGQMIYVSAQSPVRQGEVLFAGDIVSQTEVVMRHVGEILAAYGADYDDVVKLNRWYVGSGTVEDFEPAALTCGAYFREPGPAATGIPVPLLPREGQQIAIEVVAMLGEDGDRLPRRHVWPESLWDWTIRLPYHHGLECRHMIFLGGQVSLDRAGHAVHPDQMVSQTRQAMEHIGTILRELGADFADICKLTTMYAAAPVSERHRENLEVRAGYAANNSAVATDVALPVLAYPSMIIEIDAFAMTEPDSHDVASP